MKYVYNAERDRIACLIGYPHFVCATYEDTKTKETRTLYLHTCTSNIAHVLTTVEKYINDGEEIKEIKNISRDMYEKWLCGEMTELEFNGSSIPRSFITDYLIADDFPTAQKAIKNYGVSRYGDLTSKKMLLEQRDFNLIHEIAQSWEKASSKNDIVRIEAEPEPDYMHEYLLNDN